MQNTMEKKKSTKHTHTPEKAMYDFRIMYGTIVVTHSDILKMEASVVVIVAFKSKNKASSWGGW